MRSRIHVIELEGFLFFGTAYQLLEAVKARLEDQDAPKLRYLVLDFRLVRGLDSSAMMSFSRVLNLAQGEDFLGEVECGGHGSSTRPGSMTCRCAPGSRTAWC